MNIITRMAATFFECLTGTEYRYEGLPPIKFYKDAAAFGEHGKIIVTSPKNKLRNITVSFVFAGAVDAPKLDLHLMRYIWDSAAEQGYTPSEIVHYGSQAKPTVALPQTTIEDMGDMPAVAHFRQSSMTA
jgi:hypothetical protein